MKLFVEKLPSAFYSCRVGYNAPSTPDGMGGIQKPGLSVSRHIHFERDAQNFASVRELLLSTFEVKPLVDTDPTNAMNMGIVIRSRANNIAACTRRGSGNVVFVGIGTKFNLADVCKTMKIVTIDALEADELLVVYSAEEASVDTFDGPFVAAVRDDGSVLASVIQPTQQVMGSAADYGRLLKLV